MSAWEREEDGWLRVTDYPIPGTPCRFELAETVYDNGEQDASIVLLGDDLPADQASLLAAALTLLEVRASPQYGTPNQADELAAPRSPENGPGRCGSTGPRGLGQQQRC